MQQISSSHSYRLGLPLREVVSWNIRNPSSMSTRYMSTSAWGSELKCTMSAFPEEDSGLPLREVVSWNTSQLTIKMLIGCLPLREVVSWNAQRNWVKIAVKASTSAWGSELKCYTWRRIDRTASLPLREVVSWNVISVQIVNHCPVSTSAWGSELKCFLRMGKQRLGQSTSAWGSELKYIDVPRGCCVNIVYLCVR